jgi:hypothetical protein
MLQGLGERLARAEAQSIHARAAQCAVEIRQAVGICFSKSFAHGGAGGIHFN